MSGALLVLACLWVLVAAMVALLPRRWQYPPGVGLLAAAGWLIWRLAAEYGLWFALPALLAVVSMFRRPLGGLLRRARPWRGEGAS